ncbi:MAG: dodecin domain-containing protein [Chloroflexota bacterium]|jgi:hypothetical protein
MAVAKVIEISASSPESFEDAIRQGVARASKTLDDIREGWVKEQKVVIQDGRISEYRVHLNLTFVLHD